MTSFIKTEKLWDTSKADYVTGRYIMYLSDLTIFPLILFVDEGAYFSTSGKKVKDATIRWGEPPHSVGK